MTSSSRLPVVALTLGDPAGIGPELIARLLAQTDATAHANLVLVGDPWLWADGQQVASLNVPTGGVSRPMALFMMNSTPKYTGSMPACLTMGMSTGVRMSTVGIRSSAVPTTTTRAIMASSSRVLCSIRGRSNSVTSPGMLAIVISQADTKAVATRNITTLEVLAAASIREGSSGSLSSR